MYWCVARIYSVLHILPQDITNTIQLFFKKENDICCGCLYSNVFPYSHCSNIIILYHLIWSFIWFIFFLEWFVAAQQHMRRDKKRRYNSSFKLDWDDEAAQRRRPERKGEMTWRTTLFHMSLHSFYCVMLVRAKPYLPSILIRGLLQRNASQDEVSLSRRLKMKLLSAMSALVWVVVDRLFSRRAEASDRGCGGRMFDVAACRLDGWRVCLCWPQGFGAGRGPRSFF